MVQEILVFFCLDHRFTDQYSEDYFVFLLFWYWEWVVLSVWNVFSWLGWILCFVNLYNYFHIQFSFLRIWMVWDFQRLDMKVTSESEVAQSCPTLCDPMDCSLPDSSIHGIFQARVLEWGAISFSRGPFWPRDQTWVSQIQRWILYQLSYQGSSQGIR